MDPKHYQHFLSVVVNPQYENTCTAIGYDEIDIINLSMKKAKNKMPIGYKLIATQVEDNMHILVFTIDIGTVLTTEALDDIEKVLSELN